MNASSADRSAPAARHGGVLLLLAAACLVLLVGGLAIAVALGGVMPLAYGPPGPVLDYVRAQPVAVQAGAVGAFVSSVPLAVYAATTVPGCVSSARPPRRRPSR